MSAAEVIERALSAARSAGADAVDAVLVESDSHEARVRADEIEFVKQARERCLGIRALVRGSDAEGRDGMRVAITSTSDLTPHAVDKMAGETVALARATAVDPGAGLPDEASAEELPDLALLDPDDRNASVEARIEDARRAEAAARTADERIHNSEGA